MRRLNSDFNTKFISEAGRRQFNKDYFGFVTSDDFVCWAIAETYDNDNEVVSAQLAVETVLDMFTKKPTMSGNKIKSYVKEAHEQLKEQSEKFQLKASILVVVSDYKTIRYVMCGNCRIHIFRGNNTLLQSEDQSLYQHMITQGEIPIDSEKGLEESQNLFHFLGKQGRIKIFKSKKYKLEDEDVVLMTTRGLWQKVSTIEMIDALEEAKGPLDYIEEIQELFLSKQDRDLGNYTLASVFANKTFVDKDNNKKIKKYIKIAAAILTTILIITLIYNIIQGIRRSQTKNTIVELEAKGDSFIGNGSFERAMVEYNHSAEEAKKLKEVKGRKGKENNAIKDTIALKQRITQLIIDAETKFNEGKYGEAKNIYAKLLSDAKENMDFYELLDIDKLEERLETCFNNEQIDNLFQLANSQADFGAYDNALLSLDEAKNLAIAYRNRTMENEIRLKIAEINLKKLTEEKELAEKEKLEKEALELEEKEKTEKEKAEEKEKEEKELAEKEKSAALLEFEGDRVLSEGNYVNSIDYYNQAINAYKAIDMLDKASGITKKIMDANILIKEKSRDEQIIIAEGYISLADSHVENGNHQTAIDNYVSARDILRQINAIENIVEVNKKIDAAKEKKSESENAIKLLEAKKHEDNVTNLIRSREYDKAIQEYRQAQVIYQETNQIDKMLLVEDKIKNIENMKVLEETRKQQEEEQKKSEEEENKQKEDAAKEAEKQAEQQKEEDREQAIKDAKIKSANLYVMDAETAVSKGEYAKAISYINEAIRIFREAEDFAKITELNKKILEINDLINKSSDEEKLKIAENYMDLGNTNLISGNYSEAMKNYNLAKEIFRELSNSNGIVRADNKISETLQKEKEEVLQGEKTADLILAMSLETDGDLNAGIDDTAAIESYRNAQKIYQKYNDLVSILALEDKIRAILLTP